MSQNYYLSLTVEPIISSDPVDVCCDMVRLAKKLGVLIHTELNGIPVVAAAHETGPALAEEWQQKQAKANRWRK